MKRWSNREESRKIKGKIRSIKKISSSNKPSFKEIKSISPWISQKRDQQCVN
jgi:hypothetical protein